MDRYVPVEGCVVDVADTARYIYRDGSGKVLVAGLEIAVPAGRLRSVLDSVHSRLVERYGPGITCREHGTFVGPLYAWDLDTLALTLWGDSVVTLFRVDVEARATERLCDDPMRLPAKG